MTAFKNGRAALAVTAGLVGALSLGSAAIAAAPVSAYAEAAVEDTADDAFSHPQQVVIRNTGTNKSVRSDGSSVFAPGYLKEEGGKWFNVDKVVDRNGNNVAVMGNPTIYKDNNGDGKVDDGDTKYNVATPFTGQDEGSYLIQVQNQNGASFVVAFEIAEKDNVVDDSSVHFKFDGKDYDGDSDEYKADVTYNGLDWLDKLDVTVYGEDGKTELAEGRDYTLGVEVGRKTVDEAVDTDTYTVYLKSDTYDVSDAPEFTITVSPLTLKAPMPYYGEGVNQKEEPADSEALGTVRVKGLANGKLAYTGSELEPTYQFAADPAYKQVDNGQGGKIWVLDEDETVWVDVPADALNATYYGTDGDAEGDEALKDAGTYKANLSIVGEQGGNFNAASLSLEGIQVAKKVLFIDVDASAWYADSVYKANELGYMTGIEGTATFGPESGLTRAQAAAVLYKMAGASSDEHYGSNKPFSDVSALAWYGDAVAWAKSYGVVSGYPDGTFKPEQLVTREEFATMLRNYAEKSGQGEDKSADLSGYTDASQLGWSKDAVSWAVANKVMGQGVDWLAPQATITRGQVAKMVVTFQPDGKLERVSE